MANEVAWERDDSFEPVMHNARWRTSKPRELKSLIPITVDGFLDIVSVPEEVVIHWPDGTTTETTWERMMAAGMTICPADAEEGERPTCELAISCTDDPEADEPHVVEEKK